MHKGKTVLMVVAARGGSTGIPRKNVSLLKGRPLLYYVTRAGQASRFVDTVVVSTDDDEIAHLADVYGAIPLRRPPELAAPDVGVDPVVHDAVTRIEEQTGKRWDIVVTLLPTSPLISARTIDKAIEKIEAEGADVLMSLVDSTYLTWKPGEEPGTVVPAYEARLNRQYLPPIYREFGLMICQRDSVTEKSRVNGRVIPYVIEEHESADVDSQLDWMLCEGILNMARIVFVVTGSKKTGTGHFHRCLTLAEGLVEHSVQFLCMPDSQLAYDYIKAKKFRVEMLAEDDPVGHILSYEPGIVITDILDTDVDYVRPLRAAGAFVVNLEDEGAGAREAHLVINALYSRKEGLPHFYCGEKYFCMRSELIEAPEYVVRPKVENVLLTFGGTDPSNLTCKCLRAIDAACAERGISIEIITGPGYMYREELLKEEDHAQSKVSFTDKPVVMSRHMMEADVCISSCGRTVHELASLGVPSLTVAQHARELQHTFANLGNGVLRFNGEEVSEQEPADRTR